MPSKKRPPAPDRPPEARVGERTSERLRQVLPEPGFVREEMDRHAKILLAALMDPSTAMSAMRAFSSVRQALERGMRLGPQDESTQVALREAERSILTALQDAATAMLLQLQDASPPVGKAPAPGARQAGRGPSKGRAAPPAPKETDIVEVPVARSIEERPHVRVRSDEGKVRRSRRA